jgi:hypothetical protein
MDDRECQSALAAHESLPLYLGVVNTSDTCHLIAKPDFVPSGGLEPMLQRQREHGRIASKFVIKRLSRGRINRHRNN